MKIAATARRSGGWWALLCRAADGQEFATQSRTLQGAEAMIKDAASCYGYEAPEVTLAIVAPHAEQIDRYHSASTAYQAAQDELAQAARTTVGVLREQGLGVRDIAVVMGISPGRVSQLAS